MGNGLPPTPANDLGDPIRIDPGTSARTESPPPGPIGLDAKGGTPKQTQASMADRIVSYPRSHMGEHVGDGQCFALADSALRGAGAKSAADFGTITATADYVWGTQVSLADVRLGDVIQFRDYRFLKRVDNADGSFREDGGGRPHHTAIVERIDGDGAITVLEQNFEGSPVRRSQLFFTSRTSTNTSTGQTTTITVTGTFWFYRPQAR
jgi:CHAP domain